MSLIHQILFVRKVHCFHCFQEDVDCRLQDSKTPKQECSNRMCGPIILISKVIACYTSVMVVDLCLVANKYVGHEGINAVASFLRETFARYQISF